MDPPDPKGAEIRLLVSRRRELVTEQTRRAARLRDLLSGLFPALERRIDPPTRTGLVFLSHHAAPEDIRAAGAKRIARTLTRAATGLRGLEALAEEAVRAARAQTVAIPGARLRAARHRPRTNGGQWLAIADIAREAPAARDRLKAVDQAIRERLANHPDAALIPSMPGMGAEIVSQLVECGLGGREGCDVIEHRISRSEVFRHRGRVKRRSIHRRFLFRAFPAVLCVAALVPGRRNAKDGPARTPVPVLSRAIRK